MISCSPSTVWPLWLVRSLKMLKGLERVTSNCLYYKKVQLIKEEKDWWPWLAIVVPKKHACIIFLYVNKEKQLLYIYVCNLSSMIFKVENLYRNFRNNARAYQTFGKKKKIMHLHLTNYFFLFVIICSQIIIFGSYTTRHLVFSNGI